jgi:hypothetical protein
VSFLTKNSNNPIAKQRDEEDAKAAREHKAQRTTAALVSDTRVNLARQQAQAYGQRITELRLRKDELRKQRELIIHDIEDHGINSHDVPVLPVGDIDALRAHQADTAAKLDDMRRKMAQGAAEDDAILRATDDDVHRSRIGITTVSSTASMMVSPLPGRRSAPPQISPTVGVVVEPLSPIAVASPVYGSTNNNNNNYYGRGMVPSASAPNLPPRAVARPPGQPQPAIPVSPLPTQALVIDYGRRRSQSNLAIGGGHASPNVPTPTTMASPAAPLSLPKHGRRSGSTVLSAAAVHAAAAAAATDDDPQSPPKSAASSPGTAVEGGRPGGRLLRSSQSTTSDNGRRDRSSNANNNNNDPTSIALPIGRTHHSAPGTSRSVVDHPSPSMVARDEQVRALVAELSALKEETNRSTAGTSHAKAIQRLERQVAKLLATPSSAHGTIVGGAREDGWAPGGSPNNNNNDDTASNATRDDKRNSGSSNGTNKPNKQLRPSKKESAAAAARASDDEADSESHATQPPGTTATNTKAQVDEKTIPITDQQQQQQQQQMYGYPGYGMMGGMGGMGMMGGGGGGMMPGGMMGMGMGMGGMGMMDPMWMQMQQQMWQAQSMIQQVIIHRVVPFSPTNYL